MAKLDRMLNSLPSFYNGEANPFINGLLKAWALSDDDIELQIIEAKKQLFVQTSEASYLDRNANNYGVDRSSDLGLSDEDFRELVPVISTYPKQTRSTMIALFEVFWGPEFTRANISSNNTGPYDFGAASGITGTGAFRKDEKLVKGTGTLFTTELSPGDYIKPGTANDLKYSRVSRILSDTELELSREWQFPNIALTSMTSQAVTTLSYKADLREERTIRIEPSAFVDGSAATVEELVNFINNHPEHREFISASPFLDPLLGTKLNIKTLTQGLQGSIQITGGTANSPTILDFPTTEESEIKAALFEINPNEIVVRIPSTIPVLSRGLKGSTHLKDIKIFVTSAEEVFDFSGLGATSTLDITIDTTPYTLTLTHANFADDAAVTSKEVVDEINSQTTLLEAFTKQPDAYTSVGLKTSGGSSEFTVTGGTANTILGFPLTTNMDSDLIQTNYPSSYVFDPVGQNYTVSGTSTELITPLNQGSIHPTIEVGDASGFPNGSGLLIFNFGRADQEGPIAYSSRPNNSTLIIDASHIFQNTHATGRKVNLVKGAPTTPRVTGEDYPTFVTGTESARLAAQNLIKKLIAAGVVVRFIIQFPEYNFECKVTASDDPDKLGSRTGEDPLFAC